MNDIWDEKPKSGQWVSFKYPVKSGEELQMPIYDAEKMDEWLTKLRVQYYIMKTRLEAVEDWWLMFNQCIDSEVVKNKLVDILDLSEFEAKDE